MRRQVADPEPPRLQYVIDHRCGADRQPDDPAREEQKQVRARLARQLSFAYRGDDGALPIVTMSAEWESAFSDSLIGQGEERQLALAPSRLQEFIRAVRDTFERAQLSGDSPVLLTSPTIRPYVRSIIERFRGQTPVMSQNEVHPKARLKTVGAI